MYVLSFGFIGNQWSFTKKKMVKHEHFQSTELSWAKTHNQHRYLLLMYVVWRILVYIKWYAKYRILFVILFVCYFVCLFVCLSGCLFVGVFLCWGVCLFVLFCFCLFVCLFALFALFVFFSFLLYYFTDLDSKLWIHLTQQVICKSFFSPSTSGKWLNFEPRVKTLIMVVFIWTFDYNGFNTTANVTLYIVTSNKIFLGNILHFETWLLVKPQQDRLLLWCNIRIRDCRHQQVDIVT